jgi:hypothetical protein
MYGWCDLVLASQWPTRLANAPSLTIEAWSLLELLGVMVCISMVDRLVSVPIANGYSHESLTAALHTNLRVLIARVTSDTKYGAHKRSTLSDPYQSRSYVTSIKNHVVAEISSCTYNAIIARAQRHYLLFSSQSPSVHSNPIGSVTLPHK